MTCSPPTPESQVGEQSQHEHSIPKRKRMNQDSPSSPEDLHDAGELSSPASQPTPQSSSLGECRQTLDKKEYPSQQQSQPKNSVMWHAMTEEEDVYEAERFLSLTHSKQIDDVETVEMALEDLLMELENINLEAFLSLRNVISKIYEGIPITHEDLEEFNIIFLRTRVYTADPYSQECKVMTNLVRALREYREEENEEEDDDGDDV